MSTFIEDKMDCNSHEQFPTMSNGSLATCNGVSKNGVPQSKKDQYSFLYTLVDKMVQDVLKASKDPNLKVVEFKHPKELQKILDLSLSEHTSEESLLQICDQIIKFSVKTGHSHFFNQLFGGLDQYSLGGAWMTEVLNTSQYTYEVAPVFTLMEKTVLGKMMSLAGFENGDAMFCPGGSMANMFSLNVARFNKWPEVKSKGMQCLPHLCILTSEKAHYSIKKGAALLGMGSDNVFGVGTDKIGRMVPAELEKTILSLKEQGMEPYLVNATSGTTVYGSYDPLEAIANICQKYGLWMHVDAAWGGGVLLSQKYRGLMKGVDRADSITWNPHKMMGVPLQCAAFLTRHPDLLARCHSAQAKYLFQQDKFYDVSYDTGDKSIQCGRKVDVLKLWMMWKAKGDKQIEKEIDNIMDCSRYLANLVKETTGFRLIMEPVCTNVCFYYIPPSMQNKEEDEEWHQKLSLVAPKIKELMTLKGSMMVGYQPDGNKVNFFRMIVSNLNATHADMDFVINEIKTLGKEL